MQDVADSVARWLGILSTGLLIGEGAERAAVRAQKVLGVQPLADLRRWFAEQDEAVLRDAKCAVIEASLAIAFADEQLDDAERELAEQIILLSELDEATQAGLLAKLDARPSLDVVVGRLQQPVLRELALVMAWQMASIDGHVDAREHGAYGLLADRLGIAPVRASELRALLKSAV